MGTLIDTRPEAQTRSAALAPEYFNLQGRGRVVEYEKLCRVRLRSGLVTYRWRTVKGYAIDVGQAHGRGE